MEKRKRILLLAGIVMVLALGAVAAYYIFNNYFYVTTEDARVTGDMARVNTQITGKLVACDMEEGMKVRKGEILGRQEAPNQTDTALEQSLLRAPIDGVVVKKQGTVGEVLSSGQAVGMVVDPSKLYISANIEETKLNGVHEGEAVDVRIDQYPGQKWMGKVTQVGEAANSAFALLSSSSSGSFTKVVQKVAVKIEIDGKKVQLRPGTNAVVRIHIR